MSASLGLHLQPWTDDHAAKAKAAMVELVRSEGYSYLMEAVKLRSDYLMDDLTRAEPSDTGAAYADAIAEIRALRTLDSIAEGVIQHGAKAEERLRDENRKLAEQF